MKTIVAKHVVLGAGAVGTSAAFRLARRGEAVVLVERFRVGHDRGSSHGLARITRHSYADPVYARVMPKAFDAWRELEADAAEAVYFRTGGASICPPTSDYVARVADNLRELGVAHRRMSGAEWRRASPCFSTPDDYDVVFETDAGLLSAARIVALQLELAKRFGADRFQLVEQCEIDRIDFDAERPTLVSKDVTIVADRLIVAAGAWVGKLLPEAASLRPTRQRVFYFRPDNPSPFAVGRFPVFIFIDENAGDAFYGMPDFLGSGVKAARHGGPEVDPDLESRTIEECEREDARAFLREQLSILAAAPIAREEICLYTSAFDEHFRLGCWPGRADVLVASPCSGHGFKFAALNGRILADLATETPLDVDISPWNWESFVTKGS